MVLTEIYIRLCVSYEDIIEPIKCEIEEQQPTCIDLNPVMSIIGLSIG